MINICFVCLGNICRSPMAEFIMKDKVKKLGLEKYFYITSRATSYEEEGNDIYPPAKEMLDKMGISYDRHFSKRLESSDYDKFDYFICMEDANTRNIKYIFEDRDKKVFKLLDRDIRDPWYSGNFLDTYNDLDEGINKLINELVLKPGTKITVLNINFENQLVLIEYLYNNKIKIGYIKNSYRSIAISCIIIIFNYFTTYKLTKIPFNSKIFTHFCRRRQFSLNCLIE